MEYNLCALIPTYNHFKALPGIVSQLKSLGMPVFVVDDGSDLPTQEVLRELQDAKVLHLPRNGGKGAAVSAGLQAAAKAGYTHAFQIDADGQHALDNVQGFLDLSKKNPGALISGNPVYDQSIPFSRKIGRWITHFWVWVETLSFRIKDSMCGFRIYPVAQTLATLEKSNIGMGMDFDTEIMVHLFWEKTPVFMHPVKVSYPEDNTSNFHVLRDNWRITKMHTRLVIGMLLNLPKVLFNKPKYESWFNMSERGTIFGILFLAGTYRFLGRTVCSVIAAPVVFYFYVTGVKQRKASAEFMARVHALQENPNPKMTDGFRHFMSFFHMQLDKFAAWAGDVDGSSLEYSQEDGIKNLMTSGHGGMILVSHLGCMEFSRALIHDSQKKRLHILVHSKNAERMNRVMNYFNPESNMNLMEVTQMGPDMIMFLQRKIAEGDWVVIGGDRTPVAENPRVVRVPFLGKEAAFSQGPYIMASVLQCPVYTAIAVRKGSKYCVSIELFAEKVILPRGSKQEAVRKYAQQYAELLENYCLNYKYQWYNFFDFWR